MGDGEWDGKEDGLAYQFVLREQQGEDRLNVLRILYHLSRASMGSVEYDNDYIYALHCMIYSCSFASVVHLKYSL
jgi:hypothetical protein